MVRRVCLQLYEDVDISDNFVYHPAVKLIGIIGGIHLLSCHLCQTVYGAGTTLGLRVIMRHPLWCQMRIAKDRLTWEMLQNRKP